MEAQVDKLIEVKDLLELAMFDHPEDYNIGHCHKLVTEVLEDAE